MKNLPEYVEKLPQVYRDIMLVLKAIPDTRKSAVKITGMPLSHIVSRIKLSGQSYSYNTEDIEEMLRQLAVNQFVSQDKLGFYIPTASGEELIKTIYGKREPVQNRVPELPAIT